MSQMFVWVMGHAYWVMDQCLPGLLGNREPSPALASAIKLNTAPLGQRKILKADDRDPLRVIKAAWKKRDETLLSHCAAACGITTATSLYSQTIR